MFAVGFLVSEYFLTIEEHGHEVGEELVVGGDFGLLAYAGLLFGLDELLMEGFELCARGLEL